MEQPTERPETTTEQTNERPETTAPIPNVTRPQRHRQPLTRFGDYITEHDEMDEATHNETTALVYAARKGEQDSLYLHEAMTAPDVDKFRQAMQSRNSSSQ